VQRRAREVKVVYKSYKLKRGFTLLSQVLTAQYWRGLWGSKMAARPVFCFCTNPRLDKSYWEVPRRSWPGAKFLPLGRFLVPGSDDAAEVVCKLNPPLRAACLRLVEKSKVLYKLGCR
jgi:hypothetical protein